MQLSSAYKSLPLTFSSALPRQPSSLLLYTSSILTTLRLPPLLTVSALGVDFKQIAPGLTCVWGWRKGKMSGENEDRGSAVEIFLVLAHPLFRYSLCQFGEYFIPAVTFRWQEKLLSFHLHTDVCRWRDVHPGALPCALSVPYIHLNLSVELVYFKMSNISNSFSWSVPKIMKSEVPVQEKKQR